MPFGRPVEFPRETRSCGCVVVKYTDEIESIESYCDAHWAELPDEERAEIARLRRRGLYDAALTVLVRLAFIGVLAVLAWSVWKAVVP